LIRVTIAGDVASGGVSSQRGAIADDDTTVAFTTILGSGKGEATAQASLQASLCRHTRRVNAVLTVKESLAVAGVVGPAADRDVFANIRLIREGRERGVHPDVDLGISSTCLRAISRAGKRALVLREKSGGNGLTAVANTIVRQTSQPVIIAW